MSKKDPPSGDYIDLLDAAEQELERCRRYKEAREHFAKLFLETGPYRRELYPKQMEFFTAGARFKRLFMAANRGVVRPAVSRQSAT